MESGDLSVHFIRKSSAPSRSIDHTIPYNTISHSFSIKNSRTRSFASESAALDSVGSAARGGRLSFTRMALVDTRRGSSIPAHAALSSSSKAQAAKLVFEGAPLRRG